MGASKEQYVNHNKNKKLFIWAAGLTVSFALIEIVYGFISGSLMIIGDGVHMSSDAISLILSLVAAIMATKAATKKRTFGYKRFEPIAAFINGLTLILIPLYIMYEAVNRMIRPVEIIPEQMITVGIIGLLINALVGYILSKGDANLNMRSAILHVFADMITSLSAVIVALAIMFFDLVWLDPVGSIVTSFIIIRGGISITKESFNILMEGTPEGYSVDEIKKSIQRMNGELKVQDVKVWCVNEAEVYTMIRVNTTGGMVKNMQKMIKDLVSGSTKIPAENIFVDVN
ncbi:cation transporter [Bacillus sp. ISL-41]|uniref:cation diffusion facilitator family transporter n=1 Tax=Bacillus sp. ISL-41 TaxID=2819127 RepID=UPI001BE60141|nr:cation diffusion facilitator family transporter [Bacillus sp. ISL-41]MBT2642470.1 cation transporter [Bacillus sp. ISL-41]